MSKNIKPYLISMLLGISIVSQSPLSAVTTAEYAKLWSALSIAPAKIAHNIYAKNGNVIQAKKARFLVHLLRGTHNLLGIYTFPHFSKGDIPGYQIAWLAHDAYQILLELCSTNIDKSNDSSLLKSDGTKSNIQAFFEPFTIILLPLIEGTAYTYASFKIDTEDQKEQILAESIGSLCAIIDNFLATDKDTNASNWWLTAIVAQLLFISKHIVALNNAPQDQYQYWTPGQVETNEGPPYATEEIYSPAATAQAYAEPYIQSIPFDSEGNMQFSDNTTGVINRQYDHCSLCLDDFTNGDIVSSICNQRHVIHLNCYNNYRATGHGFNCWECRQGSTGTPTYHRLDSNLNMQ